MSDNNKNVFNLLERIGEPQEKVHILCRNCQKRHTSHPLGICITCRPVQTAVKAIAASVLSYGFLDIFFDLYGFLPEPPSESSSQIASLSPLESQVDYDSSSIVDALYIV